MKEDIDPQPMIKYKKNKRVLLERNKKKEKIYFSKARSNDLLFHISFTWFIK